MQVTGLPRPDCRAARLLHFAAAPLSAYVQQSRDFLLDTIHTTQKAMGSVVRARSSEPGDPFVATTTASTGRRAALAAARCEDGQTVDDACELCPRRFERK